VCWAGWSRYCPHSPLSQFTTKFTNTLCGRFTADQEPAASHNRQHQKSVWFLKQFTTEYTFQGRFSPGPATLDRARSSTACSQSVHTEHVSGEKQQTFVAARCVVTIHGAACAPEPAWKWRHEENPAPLRNRTPVYRPVASHFTDWAILDPPPLKPWLYSPWMTLAASHIGGFLSYLDRR
jgi:hypothetical protein